MGDFSGFSSGTFTAEESMYVNGVGNHIFYSPL